MLVLSRRIGESIVIDDVIQITVTGVQRGKVRLGITAPTDMPVDRHEVHERRAGFLVPAEVMAARSKHFRATRHSEEVP